MHTAEFSRSLSTLQRHQHDHDEKYHPDIFTLPHPEQLRHYALHFGKYTGRLTERAAINDEKLKQTLADIFIIALAAANILNMEIREEPITIAALPSREKLRPWLLEQMAYESGRLAKVMESLDHMEAQDYRKTSKEAVAGIVIAVRSAAYVLQADIGSLTVLRWKDIEVNYIM